jgi:hypothetical protein
MLRGSQKDRKVISNSFLAVSEGSFSAGNVTCSAIRFSTEFML